MLTGTYDVTISVPDVVLSTLKEMNDEKAGYLQAQPTQSFVLCSDLGKAQFKLFAVSQQPPMSLTMVHLEVWKGIFTARHNDPS